MTQQWWASLFPTTPRCRACPITGPYPGGWTPFTPWGAPLLDQGELSIATALIAPLKVQRQARAMGIEGIMMIRPPGLAEALERSGLDMQPKGAHRGRQASKSKA